MTVVPPENLGGLKKMTYTTDHIRMPERSVVNLKNCSFRITAEVEVSSSMCSGVIACQGGNMAGWTLYLNDDGCPVYHYNWMGHDHFVATSLVPLSTGRHEIVVDFVYDGGFGVGGHAVLLVDAIPVAHVRVERTVPIVFSMSGESFDIGMDTGAPVGNYPHVYRFTGEIREVTLERLDEPNPEIAARIAEGEFRAAEVKGQNFAHRNRKGQSRAGREKSSCRRTTSVRSGVDTSSKTASVTAAKRWMV